MFKVYGNLFMELNYIKLKNFKGEYNNLENHNLMGTLDGF